MLIFEFFDKEYNLKDKTGKQKEKNKLNTLPYNNGFQNWNITDYK